MSSEIVVTPWSLPILPNTYGFAGAVERRFEDECLKHLDQVRLVRRESLTAPIMVLLPDGNDVTAEAWLRMVAPEFVERIYEDHAAMVSSFSRLASENGATFSVDDHGMYVALPDGTKMDFNEWFGDLARKGIIKITKAPKPVEEQE